MSEATQVEEQTSILEALSEADASFEDWIVETERVKTDMPVDPTPQLVDSIRRFGVLSPLLVRGSKADAKTFRVIDGRRRLAAARAAGVEEVPVRIITGRASLLDSVFTLQTNNNRSNNPVSELHAIEKLIDAGATDRDLVEATGLPVQSIRARLRLQNLDPDLRSAWEEGRVGLKAAEAAARLDSAKQAKLLETLDEEGKLTTQDVYEVRKVGTTIAADSLDDSIFEPVGLEPWQVRVGRLLEQAVKIVPEEDPVAGKINRIRKALQKGDAA